jgi:hypothetical protein
MEVALGDWIACRLVTRFKFPRAQVRFDRRHDPAPTDES